MMLVARVPRFDITLDDRIKYQGSTWLLSRRRDDELDFLDPRTGELKTLTDEQLAGLIALREARLVLSHATRKDEIYAAATADLAMLPTAAVKDGRRAKHYTDELRARRMTYRPATVDVERAIADVATRISDPQPPAAYLVKRWLKKAERCAAGGGRTADETTVSDFVPRHSFKGNRSPRVCFEVSKVIHASIETVYLTPERRSVELLLAVCRDRVRNLNEDRDPLDQLKLPGRKAVENAIGSLPRDEVVRRRHGPDKAYDAVGPVQYRARPEQPLDEIEMDHTACDIFVVDGLTGAPLGRPTIVIGIDRCTAMPWGIHVGFDPPSIHTVMQCMRNGMLPKTYVRINADAGHWNIVGSWPVFGRPKKLSVDRGAENINHAMLALGVDLPIKEIEAKRGRTGRYKGGIERFLGTLNRTFLQEQRGTTFSNIADRADYDPRKNAVITHEELLEKIHAWLVDVYICNKHGGIKDVPLRLWNEKIANYKPRQVENTDKLLPLFGRIETRTLRRDGIRWENLFFSSPELMALLVNPEFLKASTERGGKIAVRFRYDPSNIDHLHVYLPHARGKDTMHLRVPVEARAQEYARGLSVWAHKSIMRIAQEKTLGGVDLAALDAAKTRLIADLDRDMPGSAKIRGLRRIARIRQIGGVAPYGDSIRTTPEGSFEDRRQQAAIDLANAAAPAEDAYDYPKSGSRAKVVMPISSNEESAPTIDSDTASSRKEAKSRRRIAVPATATPANSVEIDFYSDEVKA